uniref:AP-1 complex subunit gamma n=1 Tax=Ciona savignyi TaxID=51511 RepID=H2ZPK1_CIOSA
NFRSNMPVPNRLRDLIRNIRSCKTAADERAIIQKECADIRNGFREEDTVFRCRNVAKVLYIYMLGYPAHFGQLEALKLIVSSRFTDKRIGYLGAMLLVDEYREVHLLMTNSLKNDMDNPSQYVQSLALCTLGNVCSTEMARDLTPDVEKLMKTANAYVKKKAILCACRIVRKVPEMMENFIPLTKPLLSDKNHGVMLTAVALITECCRKNPDAKANFKKLVPTLVRILKNLIMSGYSPEHDVNGISDPFLQVRILRLLRILGQNDSGTSETMNDILAQVATNTETSKNVGNAILYETVLTIMDIKSESGLRVLAVNILGRFLLNNDKNIRYVALNSLLRTVHTDMNAVQRHRTTVLDCLKDPDPSILRRAMELCFALVNSTNVRGTMRELLLFLSRCPIDFKSDCSSGIFTAAEKYAPNARWHIDTMLKVLTTAGNHVRDDAVPNLIHLLSATDKMHAYSAQQLFKAVSEVNDLSVQPLTQVACWCLGEYGDELVSAPVEDEPVNISEKDVLDMLDKVLRTSLSTAVTKSYAINAVMKLSTRFQGCIRQTQEIISIHSTSHNMEVQQRSVEYNVLFNKHDNLRPGVLEHMPQFEKVTPPNHSEDGEEGTAEQVESVQQPAVVAAPEPQQQSNVDLLLDLVDFGSSAPSTQPPPPIAPTNNNDLSSLLDLGFSGQPQPAVNGYNAPPPMNNLMGDSLLDGLNSQAPNNIMQTPGVTAFEKSGLLIKFQFEREGNVLNVNLTATNSNPQNINDFVFQAAVPKSFQLQMLPPSGNSIGPSNSNAVTQTIRLNNPNKAQPRLRMRIAFSYQGQPVQEMAEFNDFPPSAWQ